MATKKKEKVNYFSMLPESYIQEILLDPKFNKDVRKKLDISDFLEFFGNDDKISIDELIEKLKELKEENSHKFNEIILEHYSYYDDFSLTFYGFKEVTLEEKLDFIKLTARDWYLKYDRKLKKEQKERETYERLKKKFES